MKYIIFLIVAGLFMQACAPKVINSSTTTEKDSLATRIVHHHDTLRIKGDSVKVIVKETIRDTVIVEKRGRAELDIVKKNGTTTTKCKCDSIQKALDIVLQDTTRYRLVTNKVVRTVPVQFIPKFYKFCLWFFIAVCVLAGVYAGSKLKFL